MSTGSVGYLEANENDYDTDDKDLARKWKTVTTRQYGRPTIVAKNYVLPTALVVDVLDDKTFLTRYVASTRSGVVYDLKYKFTTRSVEESRPLSLIMGDVHVLEQDENAIQASKEMISMLKPKEVVVQDFFDGASVNHHEINRAVDFQQVPSLHEEALITKELLDDLSEISEKVIYLQSNHENFLLTWLNGPQNFWRLNRNYELACELQLYRLKTGKHPIIKLLELESYHNVEFVSEKDKHYVGKVLVKHGHEGYRQGFIASSKIYNYFVQGHLHSPAVFRNSVMVGLTSKLDQGYNDSCSSNWGHANAIIHPDSSIQLLNIIEGVWIK